MSKPVSKGLQCKDISDEIFLKAVDQCSWARDRPYATLWDVQGYISAVMWKEFVKNCEKIYGPLGFEAEVMDPMNNQANLISEKLIRNKARKLIRRGLMSGCYCGCRGEWVIDARFEVKSVRMADGSFSSIVYRAGKPDGELGVGTLETDK